MLELAYFNKEALATAWKKCMLEKNDHLKYLYANPSTYYEYQIHNDDKEYIEYVSKNAEGEIIGCLAASVNMISHYINGVSIIRLTEKSFPVFGRDIINFGHELLIKRGFKKIVFTSVVGNPAIAMYERFILRHNIGKIVGIYKEHFLLRDGKLYDEIAFEVYRDKFIDFVNKPIPNKNFMKGGNI